MASQQYPTAPSNQMASGILPSLQAAGQSGGFAIPIPFQGSIGFPMRTLGVQYSYMPALRMGTLASLIHNPHTLPFLASGSSGPGSPLSNTQGLNERDSPGLSFAMNGPREPARALVHPVGPLPSQGRRPACEETSPSTSTTTIEPLSSSEKPAPADQPSKANKRQRATVPRGLSSTSSDELLAQAELTAAMTEPRGKKPDESVERYLARRKKNNESAKESRDRKRDKISQTIADNNFLKFKGLYERVIIDVLQKRLVKEKEENARLREQLEAEQAMNRLKLQMDAVLVSKYDEIQEALRSLCDSTTGQSSREKLDEAMETIQQLRQRRENLVMEMVRIKPEPNDQPKPE